MRLFTKKSKLVTYQYWIDGANDTYGDSILTKVTKSIKALKDQTTRPLTFPGVDGKDRIARVSFWVPSGTISEISHGETEPSIIDGSKSYVILSVDDTHGKYDRIWCEEQRYA